MAVVNGYCSVADVREHIDDSDFNNVSVALIERAINATSRAIDAFCGFPRRKFWIDLAPIAHEYVVSEPGVLYVDDIASKAGLVVQTDSGDGTYGSTWAVQDYQLTPLNAAAYGPAYAWTKIEATGSKLFPVSRYGRPTVKITGLHGWSAVPAQVEEACLLRVTSLLKRKDAPFGVAGFGEFGTSVRIRADDPDVVDLLKPFIRYGAGTV